MANILYWTANDRAVVLLSISYGLFVTKSQEIRKQIQYRHGRGEIQKHDRTGSKFQKHSKVYNPPATFQFRNSLFFYAFKEKSEKEITNMCKKFRT
jgi:hypothetical protein